MTPLRPRSNRKPPTDNSKPKQLGTDHQAAPNAPSNAGDQSPPSSNTRRNSGKRAVICSSTTVTGYPCQRVADPKNDDGLCFICQKSKEEQYLLHEQAKAIRTRSHLKPHDLMKSVIESNPIAFMQPYLDALGIRIVFVPDANDPKMLHPTAVMDPNSNGATLFGVSKDGQVVVSRHKDIEAQQKAAERLFDRVYGKPKQTNLIAGANQTDDPNIVPFDAKRQAEVAAILEASRRPSHSSIPQPNSNN